MTRTAGGWRYLLALLVGVLLGGLGVPSAQAAVSYEVGIAFTSVVANATGITLAGTATSTGTDSLYKVQVVLWGDSDTITTEDSLQAVLALDPDSDPGDRVAADSATAIIVSGTTTFVPGQTADFTVSATWDDLGVTADGAYLVGVHVRASAESWGPLVTIGHGRTLVTRSAGTSSQATLVELASAPSLVYDDVFVDDHLAEELAGRLSTLIDLARRPGVSWAIDPALYHEISVMSEGYQVIDDSGLVEGSGQALAIVWLSQYAQLDQQAGYRLPWGNPDLAAAATLPDTAPIINAQAAIAANPQLARLPLLVRPANGEVDQGFLNFIEPLHPAVVLAQARTHATWGRAVLLDTHLVAYPAGIDGEGTDADLQRLQRAWAEDLIDPDAAIRVIADPADTALASQPIPPWANTVLLNSIRPTTPWTSDLSYAPSAGVRDLVAPAVAANQAISIYSSLINDPESANSLVAPQMAALSSQSSTNEAAVAYGQAVADWVSSITSAVSIIASPEVTLTDRTSVFPVTVVNNLSVPVRVQISAVEPDRMQISNISITGSGVVTVQPHDKLTITIATTVLREGEAETQLQLATADGQPVNQPVTVHIKASITAWMGWVVVGSAIVLFTVGTIVRVKTKSARLRRTHGRQP